MLKKNIKIFIKTILIGLLGGIIFNILLLPLPWMLGPAFSVAIFALSGVNVDLSQASIDLFNISRPKDKNIRAAITDYDGNTHYHENGLINQQNSLEGKSENIIDIKAYKLNTLLEELGIDKFNFLNIDAEGHDFKVISNFNFDKYRPQLISIEHNSYNLDEILSSDIHILMSKNKYFLASKYGVTSIYIDLVYKDKIDKLMSI